MKKVIVIMLLGLFSCNTEDSLKQLVPDRISNVSQEFIDSVSAGNIE